MNKRSLSLLLVLMLALGALLVPALSAAEDDSPTATTGYYYVYTANGKTLNVRDTPGGEVVGHLKYGTRIWVDTFVDDNWALITYAYDKPGYGYGDYACFVSTRYLVHSKPDPYKPASSGSSSSSSSSSSIDAMEEINREFRSAVSVTPYRVLVRPTRVSGWVNLRWAPSKQAELMGTYKANEELLVISETTNWYQVEDPDTGAVGFINRSFVTK